MISNLVQLPVQPNAPLKGQGNKRVVPDMRYKRVKDAVNLIRSFRPDHVGTVSLYRGAGYGGDRLVISPEAAEAVGID